jgi:hypothetical protein
VADDEISKSVSINVLDAMSYAIELRLLMTEIGVEKFPSEHPLRKLERALSGMDFRKSSNLSSEDPMPPWMGF